MKLYEIENIANINYGTRVVKKRDSGTIYDVYGGGGKTFKVDSYNRENCVIISRFGMSEKCVRRVDGKFFLNDSGLSVETKDPNVVIQKYIDWFLFSKMFDIYLLGRGAAQKNLDVDKFRLIKIPVPSLHEQEKIVERLDKVVENIDKLTNDVTKNIENSKNLFFSYLNETFRGDSSGDLIELEKLSTYISRGMQPKYTDNSKTLIVNQRCIRDNQINFEVGRYHDQNIKKVSDDKKIQIGDILINSTGVGTLGRVAQVTELPSNDVTVDTHVTIFRPNFNILSKEFTNWLFIYLEKLIEKMGVGASGQTELRREDLKNMKIINPPNEKIQQDISDRLNKLKNPYDNYLRLKEDLIIKYSMLRKSILDKEFYYE
ncbi:restriction endonuclease subunit S [Acidimicrobiia bacterium]|nr:restriction endonuclease subunit S [Acidimicrobiia bacterium]